MKYCEWHVRQIERRTCVSQPCMQDSGSPHAWHRYKTPTAQGMGDAKGSTPPSTKPSSAAALRATYGRVVSVHRHWKVVAPIGSKAVH